MGGPCSRPSEGIALPSTPSFAPPASSAPPTPRNGTRGAIPRRSGSAAVRTFNARARGPLTGAGQVCSYALLDVLSKVVVSFVLLSGHDALSVAAPKEFA